VQIADRSESGALARRFEEHGFKALDLTHDELAKTHMRHLVGGKSALADNCCTASSSPSVRAR
jgi:threonine dehydratase